MARPKPRRSRSPLDDKERELAEQEHRLQAQMVAIERELADAPRRAEEKERLRREALREAVRLERSPARSRASAGGRRYTPMLKRERRAAHLKSIAMFVLLIIVLVWLLSRFL